ncbi:MULTISPECIES: hypothetical protein [unclassified Bartonella]|uniref:hypothetical protein n=1 Tax=unclassified Bartonella TaxID=2645622 RepID=UPI0035D1392E
MFKPEGGCISACGDVIGIMIVNYNMLKKLLALSLNVHAQYQELNQRVLTEKIASLLRFK